MSNLPTKTTTISIPTGYGTYTNYVSTNIIGTGGWKPSTTNYSQPAYNKSRWVQPVQNSYQRQNTNTSSDYQPTSLCDIFEILCCSWWRK